MSDAARMHPVREPEPYVSCAVEGAAPCRTSYCPARRHDGISSLGGCRPWWPTVTDDSCPRHAGYVYVRGLPDEAVPFVQSSRLYVGSTKHVIWQGVIKVTQFTPAEDCPDPCSALHPVVRGTGTLVCTCFSLSETTGHAAGTQVQWTSRRYVPVPISGRERQQHYSRTSGPKIKYDLEHTFKDSTKKID